MVILQSKGLIILMLRSFSENLQQSVNAHLKRNQGGQSSLYMFQNISGLNLVSTYDLVVKMDQMFQVQVCCS